MKESLPSSIKVHTAQLVSTLVWLNSKNKVSSVAGSLLRLGLGVAIGAEQRQLAVPRQRDLRAGIAALLDVLPDQPIEMLQRRRGKAEARRVGGWQRIAVGHGCLLRGIRREDAT